MTFKQLQESFKKFGITKLADIAKLGVTPQVVSNWKSKSVTLQIRKKTV